MHALRRLKLDQLAANCCKRMYLIAEKVHPASACNMYVCAQVWAAETDTGAAGILAFLSNLLAQHGRYVLPLTGIIWATEVPSIH